MDQKSNIQTISVFKNSSEERMAFALSALRQGRGVIVADHEQRENEGDMIFSAEFLTEEQMALMIREGSGIVCLCLPEERTKQLDLPPMCPNNEGFETAFTVSIDAAKGVSTGVSALDRVITVKTAIAEDAKPCDLNRPGHMFPLKAKKGGVLTRPGHTEATVDLMRLAGLKPYGVLCEVTNPDGSMARLDELKIFSEKYNMPLLTIDDIIAYRNKTEAALI